MTRSRTSPRTSSSSWRSSPPRHRSSSRPTGARSSPEGCRSPRPRSPSSPAPPRTSPASGPATRALGARPSSQRRRTARWTSGWSPTRTRRSSTPGSSSYLKANGYGDVEIAKETIGARRPDELQERPRAGRDQGRQGGLPEGPGNRDLERRDRPALRLHPEVWGRRAGHRHLARRLRAPLAQREHPARLPREGDALARARRSRTTLANDRSSGPACRRAKTRA